MGRAGYIDPSSSPPAVTEFPIGERPQSSPQGRRAGAISREHTDLEMETDEGVFWNYPQPRRRTWELIFRCTTEAHLDFFETLHLAVDGHSTAFYFIPDVDESPRQEYLVRKEKDFLPLGVEVTLDTQGRIIGVFDYVLRMKEESEAAQILA